MMTFLGFHCMYDELMHNLALKTPSLTYPSVDLSTPQTNQINPMSSAVYDNNIWV